MAKDTDPVVPPGAVGLNVTGTVSRSPRCSLTGNEILLVEPPPRGVSVTWPRPNWSVEAEPLVAVVSAVTPVTVTWVVAVTVTLFAELVEPTGAWKAAARPVASAA